MKRVHYQAAIDAIGTLEQCARRADAVYFRPAHEFQIGGHAEARSDAAEFRETIGETSEVGVLAGRQQVRRSKRCRCLDCRDEVGDARIRSQTKDLDIEHGNALAGKPLADVAHGRRVADDVVLAIVRRGGNEPQSDVLISGGGGARDHLRRRELDHRQRGE